MKNKQNINCLWYRRMLRIPWVDHVTSTEVLRCIERDRELLDIIKERKTSYLGEIVCNNKYEIFQLIMLSKTGGKRGIQCSKCRGYGTSETGLVFNSIQAFSCNQGQR